MKEETIRNFCKGCNFKTLKYNNKEGMKMPFCLEAGEYHRYIFVCPLVKK